MKLNKLIALIIFATFSLWSTAVFGHSIKALEENEKQQLEHKMVLIKNLDPMQYKELTDDLKSMLRSLNNELRELSPEKSDVEAKILIQKIQKVTQKLDKLEPGGFSLTEYLNHLNTSSNPEELKQQSEATESIIETLKSADKTHTDS